MHAHDIAGGNRCAEYLEEKLSSNITLVSQLPSLSSQEPQTRTPLNTSVHLDGEKSSNTHTLQEDSPSLTNCNQATATTMESVQSTDDVQATDVLSTRDLVRKVVTLESHICQLRKELCIVSKSINNKHALHCHLYICLIQKLSLLHNRSAGHSWVPHSASISHLIDQ